MNDKELHSIFGSSIRNIFFSNLVNTEILSFGDDKDILDFIKKYNIIQINFELTVLAPVSPLLEEYINTIKSNSLNTIEDKETSYSNFNPNINNILNYQDLFFNLRLAKVCTLPPHFWLTFDVLSYRREENHGYFR